MSDACPHRDKPGCDKGRKGRVHWWGCDEGDAPLMSAAHPHATSQAATGAVRVACSGGVATRVMCLGAWAARPHATSQSATGVVGLRTLAGLRRHLRRIFNVGCAPACDEVGRDRGGGVARIGGIATR